MKASDLIALKLSQYSDYVFNGQGGSVVHILDSLYKRKDIKPKKAMVDRLKKSVFNRKSSVIVVVTPIKLMRAVF